MRRVIGPLSLALASLLVLAPPAPAKAPKEVVIGVTRTLSSPSISRPRSHSSGRSTSSSRSSRTIRAIATSRRWPRALTGFTVLIDAVNRAKPTNPEEIRKALVATNIAADQLIMPWTGAHFDEKGQNTGIRAIMQQIQKAAYATIWPFDLAAAKVMYPLPGYKEK